LMAVGACYVLHTGNTQKPYAVFYINSMCIFEEGVFSQTLVSDHFMQPP
jgi:hypothetical protein